MSKLQIIKGDEKAPVLNKEQKRFNKLVSRIAELRLEIERVKELDLELRRLGDERVTPAEKASALALKDWVLALHHAPHKDRLSKKMKEKFGDIMVEEVQSLLSLDFLEDDTELHDIFNIYNSDGRSYEEVKAEVEKQAKEEMAFMANMMFGMDLEPEDLDDPVKMQEKLAEKRAAMDAEMAKEAEARAQKQAQKKKSDTQIANEEKKKAAESAVKKTARQIYFDLVNHFHPDREQDETLRLEKTEIMKQITAAYQADDHLKLLELQMTLLAERTNAFANFDNTQLNYFNRTLQQQVNELEEELFQESPEGNGNRYGSLYHANRKIMLANVEKHIQHQKKLVKNNQSNIKMLQNEKIFKEFVREYELEDDMDFDFF